jgi:hypothetical protein
MCITPICPADRGKNCIFLWGEETSCQFYKSGVEKLLSLGNFKHAISLSKRAGKELIAQIA